MNPPGAVLFVTYRLAGSVPKSTVRYYRARKAWLESELRRARTVVSADQTPELKRWLARIEQFDREWFLRFETILHQADVGPTWMRDERIAEVVASGLRALDNSSYRLDAYSVMSNHVHTIFKPFLSENNITTMTDKHGHPSFISNYPSLSRIMHSLKGTSARECNRILSRSGNFWEHESFDHVIRPGKFGATLRYVLNNPVKVGLVTHWRQWPWNYCRKELSDKL